MKKAITIIQIVWTILAVIAVIVSFSGAFWLHSMRTTDPERQLWTPRWDTIGLICWLGVIWPWLLFSVIHLSARIVMKITAADKTGSGTKRESSA